MHRGKTARAIPSLDHLVGTRQYRRLHVDARVLAVLINSNFVGCSTRRSDTLA
jgi:hypothetical protein